MVGSALDYANGRTVFSIFDAARLADGPVARATLPYALPFGLHGSWLPA